MPIIPRANPGDIARIDPLPGVRNSARAPGSVGLGEALTGLASAATQVVEREQQKADTAYQMQIENDLAGLENHTLYDPKDGALAKRGQDALNLGETVLPIWDRGASEIVSRAPRRLQQWAAGQAQERRTAAERRLAQHTLEQGHAFMVQQADSLQANAQNAALLNYTDPDRVDKEITLGSLAIDRALDLSGADDITRQNARATFASQTQRKVIERMLVENPLTARTRLAQTRDRLTGEDQGALDQQLGAIEHDLQGDVDARWAEGGGTQPEGSIFHPGDGKAPPPVPGDLRTTIEAAADRHGVPRSLALALAQQESGFNPKAVGPETKYGRAKGLFQYVDATANSLGIDASNPEQSADAAMRQLSEQAKAKGWDWAIAHHFAGPDPKQHGPRTATYVARVKEKARRFHDAGPESESPAITADGPATTLSTALERVQKIPDPSRRRVAEQKVKERFAIVQQRQEEAQSQLEDGIYTKVANANPALPLRQVLSPTELAHAARSEKLMGDINRFRREAAAGPTAEDDAVIVDALFRLQALDPKRFAVTPLRQYATKLTGKTLKEFADAQGKLRGPGGGGDATEYATLAQQLDVRYRKLGWATDGKDNAEDRGNYLSAYMTIARQFTERQNRKPSADERDKLMDALMVEHAHRASAGAPEPLWKHLAHIPQIDSGTRSQIVAAWQSVNGRNRTPTEQQVLQLYFMEHPQQ